MNAVDDSALQAAAEMADHLAAARDQLLGALAGSGRTGAGRSRPPRSRSRGS